MTKTQQQNARRSAKAIAKERGITYQQALDVVAQEAGHPHWSAMKAAMEASETSPLSILDPAIKYGWDRRGESMNLVFDETGTSLIVNTGNRFTFGIGLNPEGTAELKRQFAGLYGFDIDDEIDETWSATYTVTLSGKKYDLPIRIVTKDEKREIEIQLPSFEERAGANNPLDYDAMDKVGALLWHCDHGLTVICEGTREDRYSAAEHLVHANPAVANIGIFEEDEIDSAIAHSHGWHAILMFEDSGIFTAITGLNERDKKIRFISAISLGIKPASILTFEDPYPSYQGDASEEFILEVN